jgi:hypothetical protein
MKNSVKAKRSRGFRGYIKKEGILLKLTASGVPGASIEGFIKSRRKPISVIPLKEGIQIFYWVKDKLDSRLRGNDGFLRVYLNRILTVKPD